MSLKLAPAYRRGVVGGQLMDIRGNEQNLSDQTGWQNQNRRQGPADAHPQETCGALPPGGSKGVLGSPAIGTCGYVDQHAGHGRARLLSPLKAGRSGFSPCPAGRIPRELN